MFFLSEVGELYPSVEFLKIGSDWFSIKIVCMFSNNVKQIMHCYVLDNFIPMTILVSE